MKTQHFIRFGTVGKTMLAIAALFAVAACAGQGLDVGSPDPIKTSSQDNDSGGY